jgi:head-tail adaptor
VIGHLLNSTVTVYRPSTVTDAVGGQTVTLASVGTVRAKVGQPSAAEMRTAGQWAAQLTHTVHAHRDADLERGDELDTGAAGRLRVLAIVQDSHRTYLRADCEAFQPEGSP